MRQLASTALASPRGCAALVSYRGMLPINRMKLGVCITGPRMNTSGELKAGRLKTQQQTLNQSSAPRLWLNAGL